MDHLTRLENRSIHIIREAYARFARPAMLWSIGKDSTVLLHLARKAFLGACPMPLIHIDTTLKVPGMIEHRDRLAREWGLSILVRTNHQALAAGMGPSRGRMECCAALKTDTLRSTVDELGLDAVLLGIRRDEERSRSKERVFSARQADFSWRYREQAPEVWDAYNTDLPPGAHMRVHPLLDWREVDVWEYIGREGIPVVDLYFSRGGKRYRSLGCLPCTEPISSEASTVEEIVAELRSPEVSERAGRSQDLAEAFAMQYLRARGYM